MTKSALIVVYVLFLSLSLFAQNSTDQVHLFQNFMRDATITSVPYGEGFFNFSSYEYGSSISLGAQGGYGINPELEVNAALGFISYSPEHGDGTSGITDLLASGRYLVHKQDNLRIAAGGFITLPIGDEKAMQGHLNFGAFGALRYALESGLVVTGTLGLDFYETKTSEGGGYKIVNGQYIPEEVKEKTEYKNSLAIGGGVIYPQSESLSIVGELLFKTDVDYSMLSGGVDYNLNEKGRVRGSLGLGLDDGAPDFMLLASYLLTF